MVKAVVPSPRPRPQRLTQVENTNSPLYAASRQVGFASSEVIAAHGLLNHAPFGFQG